MSVLLLGLSGRFFLSDPLHRPPRPKSSSYRVDMKSAPDSSLSLNQIMHFSLMEIHAEAKINLEKSDF